MCRKKIYHLEVKKNHVKITLTFDKNIKLKKIIVFIRGAGTGGAGGAIAPPTFASLVLKA